MNFFGGELRRRFVEDEFVMRGFLQEGDFISVEVQVVFFDGVVFLYMRSLKYGKLGQGVLVQVFFFLVKWQKIYFYDLLCGVLVIFGNNGFIWIYLIFEYKEEEVGGFIVNLEFVFFVD